MEVTITDDIQKQDEEMIYQRLLDYNLSKIEDRSIRDLGIYLDNESGNRIAGLTGHTHGNWLFIKYLWVERTHRGQHIGSQLLNCAELEAKKRGCRYVFLDTFDFQAPEFYKKHGYEEVFALENYPLTGKRFYYTKNL